jgi:hypothetical protein
MAVVAVLALGACGSGDDSTAETPPPTAESSDDGMLAPRPIEMSGGGAAAGSANAAPEAATADRSMATDMIAPYQIMNFVAGDSLPALPTNATGWVFQSGAAVTAEQVAQLATALGVTGEPQRHDENGYVYWSAGPNDGSAPYLTVNEDPQQTWNYNSAWANQTVSASAGCAIAIAEPAPAAPDDASAEASGAIAPPETKPIESVPPCTVVTTPPPVGIPTADEAEARTRDLMTAVGLDPANFKLDTSADQWYASVYATEQLDGQFGGRSFSTGFGAEGVLQYASGQLAVPAPVGPYPLVDLDTAIARLNDPSGFYMGGYGYGGGIALDSATAIATREVTPAGAGGVDVAEPDVASVPPETVPASTDASGLPIPGTGGIATVPPISAPVPVSIPTPQEVTVTLVDVQPDVWWVWDIDNTVWLLPAYRFIGDDGGSYTVPAVTDEFLVRVPVDTVPPSSEPVPLPPVTAPTETVPTETVPADTVADVTPLESSVGKTFAEFQADAEALGLTARVVERDGVSLPVTMDYNPNRVNVAVTGEGDTAIVTSIVNVG